jgi:NADH:ubiquinone oxidoreductase subunit 6 (subunit J)
MALIVVAGVLLPVAVIAGWANSTIYDSETFSDRVVALLDSSVVRHQMASRLTEQLARGGNQQAVNFRPAFELAVEAGINTDTFRSIFRTAVERTHEALLEGQADGAGLNLSDSIAIITSTLQLPGSAEPGSQASGGLADSLEDVTDRLDNYRFWQWQDITAVLLVGAIAGAAIAATVGIVLAADRRRAVRRLGWAIVIGSGVVVLLVQFVRWLASRLVSDPDLSDAVKSAVGTGMADLRLVALWLIGYGVIVIAASSPSERRYTPRWARDAARRWIERRRASTRGRVFLGVAGLVVSVLLSTAPLWWLTVAVFVGALWLGYLAVLELLALVRTRVTAGVRAGRRRWWREAIAATVVLIVAAAVVSAGLVVTTTSAARQAAAEGERKCNGDADNCDRTLAEITLAGSHNAMSSTLYPGWLFAEQIETIKGQLDAGVRALLIDTHYGVPSASKMVGTKVPVVLTDRAAELTQPTGEDYDPAIAERAGQLAARAPAKAGGTRQIYLCHNFCEMGAVSFASVLADVKNFVDTHPDDVLTLIIQDATTPADTAAAITKAGLADHAYTLTPGEPLPTLGQMIDEDKTLLVFAEQGGAGAPEWYQKAYDWFQETRYDFKSTADFSCAANRGPHDAPLFLVNHWVNASPPDPGKAGQANNPKLLADRLEQCAGQRDRVPNVVAVDFAVRAKIATTVREVASALRDRVHGEPESTPTTAPPTTVATPPPTTPPPTAPGVEAPLPKATAITSLTGGDPTQFCTALVNAAPVLAAWAYAEFSATEEQQGEADLVYGPALVRLMTAYEASAPIEMATLAKPLLARATAAVDTLRHLGLDDDAIAALAERAVQATAVADGPDGVTLQTSLAADIAKQVGQDPLTAAATTFRAAQGDPATVSDFGYVSDDVAAASNFNCPDVTIS